MSTHAQTIGFTHQAIAKCEELISSLSNTDGLRAEIEGCLRAAFDGTDLDTVSHFHQALSNDTNNTLRAAILLKEQLQTVLARIRASA